MPASFSTLPENGEGTSTTALAVSMEISGASSEHGIADLYVPFDDFGVRQAFAEVGKIKGFYVSHDQLTAKVRFTAAMIFSTLGRYFISSRNNGIWVS